MNKKTALIIILIILILPRISLFSDGFIIIKRPRPIRHQNPFPLEVSYHNVKVKIDGRVSTTYIDQEFYNPTRQRLEGTYLFPIPKGAVIKKFSMFINGKETEAELLNAANAKRIYENIVRRLKDPALLEYSKNGLFKARIYPIEPYSKKRVKISYTEILEMDNSIIKYLYPLNTEKFSSKPLKNVSINVSVISDKNIRTIYSPTHNISIKRLSRKSAYISYKERNIKPDTDFKLYFDTNKDNMGVMLKTYRKNKDGYFFLSLSPSFFNSNDRIIPKDIVFVLDVSGSMTGKKLRQAKKALKFCIENLNKNDRFNIIKFSTEAELLFDNLSSVNENKLGQTREFIGELRAIGGTNIEEALTLALKMKKSSKRPFTIMFLTDGKPTIGETNEGRLLKIINKKNRENIRIFTFGIGNEINTHLLDKITKSSRAYRTYISPEEDIEVKVSNFYTKIQSPVLTNLRLSFKGNIRVSKLYPKPLPDLFKGSSISVFGRYSGHGKAEIILKGQGENEKTINIKKIFTENKVENDFIPQLWATRRIGFILDQIRLNGVNKELKDEVIYLAKKYGVLTPYTSYLIVEDEKARVVRREIHFRNQLLVPVLADNKRYREESKKDMDYMKSKSGSGSVRMSYEAQSLNTASNYTQKKPAKSRMYISNKEGKTINLTKQFKNIQGRAIYNTGKFWVDSRLQSKTNNKNLKINKIQFLSKEYFDLLNNTPDISEFLALGQNVRFIYKNTEYEIYE